MKIEIRMAFRSTLRNWRHSLATLLSASLGLIAVTLIQGYIVDTQNQTADFLVRRNMYGHIILESSREDTGDTNPWVNLMSEEQTKQAMAALAALAPRIESVVKFMPIQGMASGAGNSVGFFGYAYDVAQGERMRGPRWKWNTIYGQPLVVSERPQVILGRGLAELLGCDMSRPGSRVLGDGRLEELAVPLECFQHGIALSSLTERGRATDMEFEIQGVIEIGLRELEDSWLLMPLDQAQRFFDSSRISMIGIALTDPSNRDGVIASLQKTFSSGHIPIRVQKWEENKVAEFYRTNTTIMNLFRNFIVLIVIVVCALSLSNTITRSIIQRSQEIGTLRALGFKANFVQSLFAWEGFFLGLTGSLLGVLVAALIAYGVNAAGITYVPGIITQTIPFRITIGPRDFLAMAILLSVVSAGIARTMAIGRSKRSVVDLLADH